MVSEHAANVIRCFAPQLLRESRSGFGAHLQMAIVSEQHDKYSRVGSSMSEQDKKYNYNLEYWFGDKLGLTRPSRE